MRKLSKELLEQIESSIRDCGFVRCREGVFLRASAKSVFQAVVVRVIEKKFVPVAFEVYCAIIWEEVEKLCSLGWGLKYARGTSFTVAKFLNPNDMITFDEKTDPEENLRTIIKLIRDEEGGFFSRTIDRKDIEAILESQLSEGGGYPERLIAIAFVMEGELRAKKRMIELLSGGLPEFTRQRVERFWARITCKSEYLD